LADALGEVADMRQQGCTPIAGFFVGTGGGGGGREGGREGREGGKEGRKEGGRKGRREEEREGGRGLKHCACWYAEGMIIDMNIEGTKGIAICADKAMDFT
jgi:hypothetical protein